ncbi:hypothetical protein M5E06_17610 [Azospirillum sp. A1-3]|uniref:hypothetical protein n=1 Tax=Azospirillum sp. A1-3 TaxID=185874 RepID=UPI0020775A2A|nr:hypothetical protein [Azospirillum sp. A1-3]MCM8735952.1 hypothetical protein [Azospirillum sp. A1-3]
MEKKLLAIIAKHSRATGHADGKAVQAEYGPGFDAAFTAILQKGYVQSSGPVGSITLSASGRYAAES